MDRLIWLEGQFWHQVVSAPFRSQLHGLNRDPPYQIQCQSPLNQLTIGDVFPC
ncbi:hypothetical protein A2U01_0084080, partial [Trifolium medium]|nr:hypothetical protein [Trifolium medium]